MEALDLRTQNDNLQWEVNRLSAENQKLRSENPHLSARVDLKAELDEASRDVATLTNQVQTYETRLAGLEDPRRNDGGGAVDTSGTSSAGRGSGATGGNSELSAELEECRARGTELLRLEREREAELAELQE